MISSAYSGLESSLVIAVKDTDERPTINEK